MPKSTFSIDTTILPRTSSDIAVAVVMPVVVDIGKTAVATVAAVETVGALEIVSSPLWSSKTDYSIF